MSSKVFNDLDKYTMKKKLDQNLSDIQLKALKMTKINTGHSGSNVFYMEMKGSKYILKYDKNTTRFRNEINNTQKWILEGNYFKFNYCILPCRFNYSNEGLWF